MPLAAKIGKETTQECHMGEEERGKSLPRGFWAAKSLVDSVFGGILKGPLKSRKNVAEQDDTTLGQNLHAKQWDRN